MDLKKEQCWMEPINPLVRAIELTLQDALNSAPNQTEGGFKHVTISNCTFESCQGLALESVDGALLEDVTVTNITMRNIISCPIFLRLGSRMRGPAGVPVGKLHRIIISNIVAYDTKPGYCSIISGIPGNNIEDVQLSNIQIYCTGGGTKDMASKEPPEKENAYPEPGMFGSTPAYGFYVRHVKGIEFNNVQVSYTDYRRTSGLLFERRYKC